MKQLLFVVIMIIMLAVGGVKIYEGITQSPTLTQAESSINRLATMYSDFDSVAATGEISPNPSINKSTTHATNAISSLLRTGVMLDVALFMLLVASPLILFSRILARS